MNDSMHNDHDLDLIAALAEGRLEDPAPAEDLIATCPECAQAFDSHRSVLEAVALQNPVLLDDLERHRLRAAVWEALGNEDVSMATVIPRPSGTPWWYRVGVVAAALFVVVGVGSQLVGERGEETGTTFATTGGDLAPTDQFNTFEAPAGGTEEQFTEETSAAQDEASPSGEADGTATTTAGAVASRLQVEGDDLAEAAAQFGRRASTSEEAHSESALTCVSQDQAAPPSPVVATEPVDVDGAPAWFVAFGSESEIATVNVYVDETCEVLYRGK